jgi:orotidine-5'-phosphate decarboxylase
MADSSSPARDRLAFALDLPDEERARHIASLVAPHVGVLKVGLELFVRSGPSATRIGQEFGCKTFLDLKLHDIPETVERAVANACQLGVSYLTVHASGGARMLERALERSTKEASRLTILAVTVLTSLDSDDLAQMGIAGNTASHVRRLADLAWSAGIRGFVCSSTEVGSLRAELGPDAFLVTPGIRPTGPSIDDQKRVGTPGDAIRAGSSLLVVGRPIRDASDPSVAAASIEREIARVL